MPVFRSQHSRNADTIRAKLDEARAELSALEVERRELAVKAALSDNPSAVMVDIEARLSAARANVELLETAEAEAERLEAERIAQARAAADKSRIRALGQHFGALAKAAERKQHAIEEMVAADIDLYDALRRAQIVLTPAETTWGGIAMGLTRAHLETLIGREIIRATFGHFRSKTAEIMGLARVNTLGDVPAESMADALRRELGAIIDALSGKRPFPAAPAPEPEPEPVAEPEPADEVAAFDEEKALMLGLKAELNRPNEIADEQDIALLNELRAEKITKEIEAL